MSPTFRSPVLDDEQCVVGEAENPSAWETAFARAAETVAGSLGGFGFNYLAGQTVRTMNLSPTANELVGYASSAAPALAFATFLAGDETWKGAMAGASLFDFWHQLAVRLRIAPLPPGFSYDSGDGT